MTNLVFLILLYNVLLHSKEEWATRNIYQLMTDRFGAEEPLQQCQNLNDYCGGTFKGITLRLDYIQAMGFNAIWISPIVQNTKLGYHGYWSKDITKINEHFGTENDLIELVTECHKRDIWVMIDVVLNHLGYDLTEKFNGFGPFSNSKYLHKDCIITDWNNQWMLENCRVCGLPDLDQEQEYVRNTLLDWISNTVKKFEFDGVRIDAAIHFPKWFGSLVSQKTGVFTIAEIMKPELSYVSEYSKYYHSLLNYPAFFEARRVFGEKAPMHNLKKVEINFMKYGLDTEYMGLFTDNHDSPRFYSVSESEEMYKNYLTYSAFYSGIPIVYYGTEQGFSGATDPFNREQMWPHYNTDSPLYQFITTIMNTRTKYKLWEHSRKDLLYINKFYVFQRGPLLFCLTNELTEFTKVVSLQNSFSNDEKLCNILDENDCVDIKDKLVTIHMHGLPKIYQAVTLQKSGGRSIYSCLLSMIPMICASSLESMKNANI